MRIHANELFMTIKLIVRSPVLPLKYYFVPETSQSLYFNVLLYVYKF